MLVLSDDARITAGVLLLTIIAIESGGYFLLALVQGRLPRTDLQKSFSRAGHAHAGVLLVLSLVALLYADTADLSGGWNWLARSGVPMAAILMPAGLFLSSIGSGRTKPNALVALILAGAAVLALGLGSLGIGLLTA